MESVMSFLADNYLIFFIAAGILCFALIGFIIDSKKKIKNEFKGETIETNEISSNVNMEAKEESVVAPIEEVKEEPVKVEEEMVINDIPLNDEQASNNFEQISEVNIPEMEMPKNEIPVMDIPSEEVNTPADATVDQIFEPTPMDQQTQNEKEEHIEMFDEL